MGIATLIRLYLCYWDITIDAYHSPIFFLPWSYIEHWFCYAFLRSALIFFFFFLHSNDVLPLDAWTLWHPGAPLYIVLRAWTSNFIVKPCDVITHPCPNFSSCSDKTLLELRHGWVIISHSKQHIDGLMQERRNSSVLTLELRLSCTNPSICDCSSMP